MNRFFLSAAMLTWVTAPALSADLELSSPVAPAVAGFSWTGFYLGVNGGGAFGGDEDVEISTEDTTPLNLGDSIATSRGELEDSLDLNGPFGGAQIGYNLQAGMFVVGVEGDIQLANLSDDADGAFSNPSGTQPLGGEAQFDIDWFTTVRARLGVASDGWLVYGTGGWAGADVSYSLDAVEGPGGFPQFEAFLDADDFASGYVVGGGIERAFGRFSLKAEYQYIDLGEIEAGGTVLNIGGGPSGEGEASSDIDVAFHTFRVGLNYRFGSTAP